MKSHKSYHNGGSEREKTDRELIKMLLIDTPRNIKLGSKEDAFYARRLRDGFKMIQQAE